MSGYIPFAQGYLSGEGEEGKGGGLLDKESEATDDVSRELQWEQWYRHLDTSYIINEKFYTGIIDTNVKSYMVAGPLWVIQLQLSDISDKIYIMLYT